MAAVKRMLQTMTVNVQAQTNDELLVAMQGVVASRGLVWHGIADQDAYVNHGRWLADCPCGDAMAVDPDIPWGVCLGCGGHAVVRFPVNAIEIERILAHRPTANQNWREPDTMAHLVADNAVRGLPA